MKTTMRSRVVAILMMPSALFASDVYVDVDNPLAADTAATGRGTEAMPYKTIQAAVDSVAAGVQTTIRIKPGVYDVGSGTADSSGIKNIVLVDGKKISLVGVGNREEIEIVGAPDPDTGGYGPGATRCCRYTGSTGWQSIKNITFRGGWTDNTTAWAGRNIGGGLWLGTASADSDVVRVYDCVFINNHARLGGGAYSGWYVRCLFRDNQNPATSGDSLMGAGGYNLKCFACVFVNNYGANTVRDSVLSSCLVIGGYAGLSAGSAANTIAINAQSLWEGKHVDFTGGCTKYSCLNTASIGERPVLSPASGDFRLLNTVTDALGTGDAAKKLGVFSNCKLDASDVATDFAGNPFPDSGTIDIGAVQGSATPAGGYIKLDTSGLYFDGKPSSAGDWLWQTAWPKMHLASVRDTETEKTVRIRLWQNDSDPVQYCLFPDMNDNVGLMAPEDTDGAYTATVTKTTNIAKVDPVNGPYKTIQSAIDAMGSNDAYIDVAEGIYDSTNDMHTFKSVVGGSHSDYLAIRVHLKGPHRIVGAGEGKSFIRGAADSETGGNGTNAVCAVFGNNSRGVLQGFTVENSYSLGKDGWSWDHSSQSIAQEGMAIGGWGNLANNENLRMQDCTIRNSAGGNKYFSCHASFLRCKFTGNTAMNMNGCDLWACLFADNVPGSQYAGVGIIGQWTLARNCTVVGNGHQKLLVDSGSANCSHAFNCVFAGGTETYSYTELADNLFHDFTVAPASSAGLVATPYFVSEAKGDYRLLESSQGLSCGDASHVVNANFFSKTLQNHCSVSTLMDGGALDFQTDGACAAGAFGTPVSSCGVAYIVAEKGGLAVSDGSLGGNVVTGAVTVTVTPAAGATRPCFGLSVNGVTNCFDAGFSYVIDAGKAASGLLIKALYSNRWYVDAENGNDTNTGYYPAQAFQTLAQAMTNALLAAGDEVHAAEGDYEDGLMKITETDGIYRRVVVPANVSLIADGDRENTLITGAKATGADADSAGRGLGAVACAYLNSGSVLRGFTLRNGRTNKANSPIWWDGQASGGGGGGVFEDCTITGCSGYESLLQYTTVRRCRIVGNLANIVDGSSGRCTSYYDCIIDNNRGANSVYGINKMINCTVGANFPDGKAVYFCSHDGVQPIVKNSLFLCDSLVSVDYGTNYKPGNWTNNYAVTQTVKYHSYGMTMFDSLPVAADTYEPVAGNPAIDALEASEANDYGLDANRGQRVYNGALDVGAVEYDYRPAFAKALGSRKITVTSASPDVVEDATSGVDVRNGVLAITWQNPGEQVVPHRFTVRVTGTGILRVSYDGKTETFTAASGVRELSFASAASSNDLVFSYEPGSDDTGWAQLSGFRRNVGTVLFVR